MGVKESLLALLSEEPRHGYALKAEFEARTGGAWPLNIGQVYTTLERLERAGLVAKRGDDGEGRILYAITDTGRTDAQQWFSTPIAPTQPPRNELAIKLAIALSMPEVDVDTLIQAQREATLHTLQTYTRAKRAADPDDTAWLLIVELMIFTAEAEVRWLDHCQANQARLRHRRRNAATTPITDRTTA